MNDSHPLYKPENRRRLKIIALLLTLFTLAAELFVHPHPHFSFESVFGFYGFCGLLSSAALIGLAWIVALMLLRRDDYYDAD